MRWADAWGLPKGQPVRFQGEKFRVLRHTGRDIVIQNIEGYRMTVHPETVQIGWGTNED